MCKLKYYIKIKSHNNYSKRNFGAILQSVQLLSDVCQCYRSWFEIIILSENSYIHVPAKIYNCIFLVID